MREHSEVDAKCLGINYAITQSNANRATAHILSIRDVTVGMRTLVRVSVECDEIHRT